MFFFFFSFFPFSFPVFFFSSPSPPFSSSSSSSPSSSSPSPSSPSSGIHSNHPLIEVLYQPISVWSRQTLAQQAFYDIWCTNHWRRVNDMKVFVEIETWQTFRKKKSSKCPFLLLISKIIVLFVKMKSNHFPVTELSLELITAEARRCTFCTRNIQIY